jgi:methylamine utilization protein MauE
MDHLVVAARSLVAVVFAVSAVSKLRGRSALDEFVASLRQFGVPAGWRRPVGIGVALGEGAIPVLLVGAALAGPSSGTAARALVGAGFGLAAGMLAAFTLAIARAVRGGVRAPCRCFGASSTPMGRPHLVRNGLLLAVAVVGLAGALLGPVASPGLGVAAVAILPGLVAGALVMSFDDLVALFAA